MLCYTGVCRVRLHDFGVTLDTEPIIGVASFGALGHMTPPLELARVLHQFGNFCLTPVGSGRLLVNLTIFFCSSHRFTVA